MSQTKTIVFVNTGIPNTYTGGGAFTAYCITEEMKKAGIRVAGIIIVSRKAADDLCKELEKYRNLVDELHIIFTDDGQTNKFGLFKKIINKFSLKIGTVYPEVKYAGQVIDIVNRIKPDAIMAYHFQALAAISKIVGVPKIGLVGDPQFAVVKFRFLYFLKRLNWRQILLLPFFPLLYFKYKKFDIQLLNQCQIKGAFAAHHARELVVAGVKDTRYYRTPIIDPFNSGSGDVIGGQLDNEFKIFLLGHLQGIATISGLAIFVQEVLPLLLKRLGRDKFVINIVGGYFDSLPNYIKNGLKQARVSVKGYLKDIKREMSPKQIFLTPTPIELGIRVRIITAMGYSNLIIAHVANQKGIPELKNGVNCLLASSGKELAYKIIDCYNKRYNFTMIKNNARLTFDKYFRSDVAAGVIIDDIKKLLNNSK